VSEARRHRRAAQRADAKRARQEGRQPVVIAGDGVIGLELPGHRYEARPHAQLRTKVPGRHRFVATAAWVLSDLDVEGAADPDRLKLMDSENLLSLAIGCWDCEQPLGAIEANSTCPAGDT
jgi:hypothetical protein